MFDLTTLQLMNEVQYRKYLDDEKVIKTTMSDVRNMAAAIDTYPEPETMVKCLDEISRVSMPKPNRS